MHIKFNCRFCKTRSLNRQNRLVFRICLFLVFSYVNIQKGMRYFDFLDLSENVLIVSDHGRTSPFLLVYSVVGFICSDMYCCLSLCLFYQLFDYHSTGEFYSLLCIFRIFLTCIYLTFFKVYSSFSALV